MKTVAELRIEHNLPVPVNKDSFYRPIERKPKKFNPLVIPKSLQEALPFASKPKNIPARKRPLLENRRAVVMKPNERKPCSPRDQTWQGMKTVAELRREHNLPVPVNKDSFYRPIERRPKKFNPLVIPKSLQEALPFGSKPKNIPA
ncbi:unnamed protein product [Fraxinus pennsylvanica]|uniref:Uncharacterized protein n=1 Tax=Fraxinus pennsylvanica TaxID=56036 RepID=A0AAD1YQT4_9LAMI|nr:unnamed protein product [Fraxinus pennsylvanica]